MRLMGSLPIRQRATIAGNIVNASPIGDMTMALSPSTPKSGWSPAMLIDRSHFREFFLGIKSST